ncbi:hypothetical protein ACFPPA_00450 [Rhodanobacter ginsengisoli]|uniref:Uncharacterized protein n=1 Tax=Rhodanobacter ginsengisoli TaxID=418646 RepID=A0ABW0QKP9_9GAMM
MGVPKNLLLLHRGEEEVRQKNISVVTADPDLVAHLDLTERAMDLIDVFVRQQVELDDDGRAIQHLGIRVFNGLATAWKLMASGYYQKAGLIQRDLIETIYLINYFHINPETLPVWRVADRKQLQREFGPVAIRKALDTHDGRGKSAREGIYYKFCNLAGHPTRAGFDMLRPKGGAAIIGPFPDNAALRALLEEQGSLAVQAGFALSVWLELEAPMASSTAHRFLTGAMDYSGRFLGKVYSPEDRADVDRLYCR